MVEIRTFRLGDIERRRRQRPPTHTFAHKLFPRYEQDANISNSDVLGSAAFKPVKSDMAGNIKKLRDRQLAKPLESESLQSLVSNELKEGAHRAGEGLLWLNRGLDFTSKAIAQNLANPSEELSTSFRAAYGDTLKPHHGLLVRPIFSAAMSATPYRKDFYAKLGDDQSKVQTQGEKWLEALTEQVGIIKEFMERKENQWK